MSNSTRTIIPGNFSVNVEHDPRLGYVVTVSKEIRGKTYCVRSIVSEYTYEAVPDALKEVLDRAIKTLDDEGKRNEIKEFNNPSFRRKDYVKQNQTVSST